MIKYQRRLFNVGAAIGALTTGERIGHFVTIGSTAVNTATAVAAGKQAETQTQVAHQNTLNEQKSQAQLQQKQQQDQAKLQQKQQQDQAKMQQEQQKANFEQQKQLLDQQKQIAEINAAAGTQSSAPMPTTMMYSDNRKSGKKFRQKQYGAVWNWNNIKGAAGDLKKIVKGHRDDIVKMGLMGGSMALGTMAVNSAIAADAKRSGIDLKKVKQAAQQPQPQQPMQQTMQQQPVQNQYSVVNTIGRGVNYMKNLGAGKEILTGAAFTIPFALPSIIGYAKQKKDLKQRFGNDQQQNFQQNQQGQQLQGVQLQRQMPTFQAGQRQYSWINTIGSKFAKFKANPKQQLAGFFNHLGFMGGTKGAVAGTKEVVNQGKISGNPITQKVGNWMSNHKTATTVGLGAIGLGIVQPLTFEGAEKVTNAIGKKVNEDAYTLDEYNNKKVE